MTDRTELRRLAGEANRPMSEIGLMEHKRAAMKSMHDALLPDDVLELLDALDRKDAEIAEIKAAWTSALNMAENIREERDALKAELAAMLEQKPVAHFIKCDLHMGPLYEQVQVKHWSDPDTVPLYAAQGAKP